jgi:hypothetical protein
MIIHNNNIKINMVILDKIIIIFILWDKIKILIELDLDKQDNNQI